MTQIWRAFSGPLPALLALVTLGAATAFMVLRRRHVSVRAYLATRAPISIALAMYALVLATVLLSPGPPGADHTFVIEPWASGGVGSPIHALGNVLLLAPSGLPIAFRWPQLPKLLIVGVVLIALTVIESIQYAAIPGRVASSSDIILGVIGCGVGLTIASLWQRVAASFGRSGVSHRGL